MLDKRLQTVASMVRDGARLADVGTDHAYLPVYLMQQHRIESAVAADIGEGPAASARQHIGEAGLQDRIAVRVCDGLSGISPDEVTDIVIAGMGGETIIHILECAPWVKRESLRLILQPMTKTVELRRWLNEHGFVLEQEHVVCDGRHVYLMLSARFGDTAPSADPLLPFVGALPKTAESRPYIDGQITYLTQRIGGLKRADRGEEAAELQALLDRLQLYITEEEI